jgi:hypothetical protein
MTSVSEIVGQQLVRYTVVIRGSIASAVFRVEDRRRRSTHTPVIDDHSCQQVAPARHIFTWLESFNEKDMPTRPLRASPSIHSCEIIFGETIAEKCAN